MNNIQETLEFILKSITNKPEDIIVSSTEEGGILNLDISAPKEMIGQIIGKQGKIIKSIRTILNLSYPNIRFSINIKD